MITIKETSLPGVKLIYPRVFGDTRGFFLETYHVEKYANIGTCRPFVQDNHSRSRRGILRGLHYQINHSQGKLIYVVSGEIYDVAVDIRRGSPNFGRSEGFILSGENKAQLFIPEGYAHGFYVLSTEASVIYKCTDLYHPEDERGILWSDPDLAIQWPIPRGEVPVLSERDAKYPMLKEVAESSLPLYS